MEGRGAFLAEGGGISGGGEGRHFFWWRGGGFSGVGEFMAGGMSGESGDRNQSFAVKAK